MKYCRNLLSTFVCFLFPVKEVDDFFEQEKTFLLDYYSKIKDSTAKAEKMTRVHKSMTVFFFFMLLYFSGWDQFN